MKKTNYFLIIGISALLLMISYALDNKVSMLFQNTNQDARFAYFDLILSIAANFGIAVLVMLVIPSIILYKNDKKAVYTLLLIFIVSFILAFAIKFIVLRQRPIEAFTYPFTSIANYSFPSMHSMAVFSLLPMLLDKIPKQRFFWIAFAFLVSFSRIYFRAHFLSDVVFGAIAGYFIGHFFTKAKRKAVYDKTKIIGF